VAVGSVVAEASGVALAFGSVVALAEATADATALDCALGAALALAEGEAMTATAEEVGVAELSPLAPS
jgi:hypothetical protein